MKKKLIFGLLVFTFILMSIMVIGCTDIDEEDEDALPVDENDEQPVEEIHYSIGTGSSGGTVYALGAGKANIIEKYVDNIRVTVETTAASVENALLVATGEAEMGYSGADVAYAAFEGIREFDEPHPDLRALFGGYGMYIHVLTLEGSGIETFEDLEGKAVAIGPSGSVTNAVMVPKILEAHGLSIDDITSHELTWDETITAIKDGVLDAGFIYSGLPNPSASDIFITHDARLLSMDEDIANKLIEEEPYYHFQVVEAGFYEGMEEDVLLLGVSVTTTINANVPDEIAYNIAAAIFEHLDELIAVHPNGAVYTPENAINWTSIPLHPGVEQYLKDHGYK